jgi:hypothetical protein
MNLGALRSLVFASYEAAFRDNEIDDGVLLSPTTEALSDVALSRRRPST